MDKARMQPGGLVRELDGQGRIVLPKDWRDSQGITPGMPLELIPGQGGALLVRPFVPAGGCVFCGNGRQLRVFSGKRVCGQCLEVLSRREIVPYQPPPQLQA